MDAAAVAVMDYEIGQREAEVLKYMWAIEQLERQQSSAQASQQQTVN